MKRGLKSLDTAVKLWSHHTSSKYAHCYHVSCNYATSYHTLCNHVLCRDTTCYNRISRTYRKTPGDFSYSVVWIRKIRFISSSSCSLSL